MMSEMDVNAIAGTLKLYFRELPEPLFTDEFYPNFAEGIGERAWEHLPSPLVRRAPPPASVRGSAQTLGARGTQTRAGARRPPSVLRAPAVPAPLRSWYMPRGWGWGRDGSSSSSLESLSCSPKARS